MTFADTYTLQVGGERVELAFHGSNHSPDNIYIHFPDHDALMLIDIVNAGWVPIYNLNLSEDVPRLHAGARDRPGLPLDALHLRAPGPARDPRRRRRAPAVHRRHRGELAGKPWPASTRSPYYVQAGVNVWAGVKGHLDAVTERAAAPVIAKYTGVLAAADIEVFTRTTTFAIMQSLRLDKGPSGPVHP